MANQHTIKVTGRRGRKTITLKLSDDEREAIDRGAALLQESRSQCLRQGGLQRAAAAGRAAAVLPFRCEFCPAQFSNLTDAMDHVETTHPQEE
jgi:uncharacterized protein (DUF1778 family)